MWKVWRCGIDRRGRGLAALLTVSLAGCLSAPWQTRAEVIPRDFADYRPTEPDHVEIFLTQQPTRRYRELALVRVTSNQFASDQLIARLRQAAAEIGADAIMHIASTSAQQLQDANVLFQSSGTVWQIEGIALKWR